MNIVTDNSKVNENLLAENEHLKERNQNLENVIIALTLANQMKEEAFYQLKEQNDALMLENIQLMHHNRRLIESIEMGDL